MTIIDLYLDPAIAKYLQRQIRSRGTGGKKIYKLNLCHFLGKLLISMMKEAPIGFNNNAVEQYKELTHVEIQFTDVQTHTQRYIPVSYTILPDDMKLFNDILKGLMQREVEIACRQFGRIQRKLVIQDFYEEYGLTEDDLPLETMYKRIQRQMNREFKQQMVVNHALNDREN